jgi:hypothetical protein
VIGREGGTSDEEVRATMLAVVDEEFGVWSFGNCVLA